MTVEIYLWGQNGLFVMYMKKAYSDLCLVIRFVCCRWHKLHTVEKLKEEEMKTCLCMKAEPNIDGTYLAYLYAWVFVECVSEGGRCWTGTGKWVGGWSSGEWLSVLWKETGPRGTPVPVQLHEAAAAQGPGHGLWWWQGQWCGVVGGWGAWWVVSMNVGAECESEKDEEVGAKPHHKQCLQRMNTFHQVSLHVSYSLSVSVSLGQLYTIILYSHIIYLYPHCTTKLLCEAL